MKRWLCWFLPGTVAGLLHAQAPAPAPEGLDSLLKNPPFGQRAVEGPQAGGAPLELRGVFVDHGETFFSLYEPSTRTSRWVGLNESGAPFTVRKYDATKGEATISYQGRDLTLALRQAKVVAMATPMPTPSAGPTATPANGPAPANSSAPTPTVTTNDEAVRLAQIAEEIRRRRALRQQGKAVSNPPTPAPPSK